MLLWDRCLVLLTCGIIVCKRLPKRCGHVGAVAVWESNHVWCSICVQRCSGLCLHTPFRNFVCTLHFCLYNIEYQRVTACRPICTLCALLSARCPHHDCCMHCLHHVGCQAFLPVCADVFNGCATWDVRHRGSVFSVGVTDFSLSLCVLHAMPPQ